MTEKADRAKWLLNNAEFQSAVESVKKHYKDAILNETTLDEDVWELRRMLFLVDKVVKDLEVTVQDGVLEDHYSEKQPSFLGDIWKNKNR